MANPLRKFNDDELLEELARRRRLRDSRDDRMELKFCHDCANYRTWRGKKDPPDDYNPCGKGHAVKFRMPEGGDPSAENYGFYRRICADRKPQTTAGGAGQNGRDEQ